jgi:sortase A
MKAGVRRAAFLLSLSAAAVLGVNGAWIPVKALVAQELLRVSWQWTRAGERAVKPWPWADTWPVARLRLARLGLDLIVLAGASGRTLAFGPGHVDGTAEPGQTGNCVLSGHRDTHFRFLSEVRLGDILELEPRTGPAQRFRVTAYHIVRDSDVFVLQDRDEPLLTLVTCYPFDAVLPGGPMRFVVQAERVDAVGAPD